MPTALVLLAPGFEEIEAVTVIDLLRRAGVEVTAAGLEKELATGSHGIAIKPDVYYRDVNAMDFDVLILPGGQPGTDHLKSNPQVLEWVRKRFETRKPLAAICAAPTVFHQAGIAKDLRLTSYPSEKEVFTHSTYLEKNVVKDGLVVTSRGVGTAIEFSLALIEELAGEEKAKEVAERILFAR